MSDVDVVMLRTVCEQSTNLVDSLCLNVNHMRRSGHGVTTDIQRTKGIETMQKSKTHNASTQSENDASTEQAGAYVEDMRSAVAQVEIKTKKNGLPRGVHKEETTDSQGRDKRLTAKMQAFASNIVQGLSPNDAYRRAYDCSNMGEASIVSEANRLLKDPRISLLLESFWKTLKENVIADHQATRRHIMSELFNHAERANERTSDKLKALELMGRAIGMFTDKVESKTEEVNVDSLKKELESSLELLKSSKSKPLLN